MFNLTYSTLFLLYITMQPSFFVIIFSLFYEGIDKQIWALLTRLYSVSNTRVTIKAHVPLVFCTRGYATFHTLWTLQKTDTEIDRRGPNTEITPCSSFNRIHECWVTAYEYTVQLRVFRGTCTTGHGDRCCIYNELKCHMTRFTQQSSCDHHMTKNPERKHVHLVKFPSLAASSMKDFETNELVQIFRIVNYNIWIFNL